ncbi:MAG: hypothetical protein QNK37_13455 [Acidobacteriota bacterium]|nr:hypothetical protein [Acidobacteriota bacterium]
MPRIMYLQSDRNRSVFIANAALAGRNDLDAGKGYIPPAVADQLAGVRQDFKSALRVYYDARADLAGIVETHAKAIDTLRACVRHLWKDLRFQYRMGRIGLETLALMELPIKGMPGFTRYDDWLMAAARMAHHLGNQSARHPQLVTSPSLAQLTEYLADAEDAAQRLSQTKARVMDARDDLQVQRDEVDRLHGYLAKLLRAAMHGTPNPALRDEMRRYGYRFRPTKTEATPQPAQVEQPEETAVDVEPALTEEIDRPQIWSKPRPIGPGGVRSHHDATRFIEPVSQSPPPGAGCL